MKNGVVLKPYEVKSMNKRVRPMQPASAEDKERKEI